MKKENEQLEAGYKRKKRSFKHAFKEQDEYYTPSILVQCILPYIESWIYNFNKKHDRSPIIWLPFDTEESKYYQILEDSFKEDAIIIHTHLNDGHDFFIYQPDMFDIIISNPPFSKKLEIMERIIFDLKKPFVLLTNIMSLNYQEIGGLFSFVGEDIQFLIPDKKVSFDGNTSSFCSGYVCYKFIDKTKFIHLPHNNTGDNFRK